MRNVRAILLSLVFLLWGICASAQILPAPKPVPSSHSKDPLDRDSPQSSVVAFLEATHSKDYAKAMRYLDLRNMPESARLSGGAELARELETILDRDTRFDVGNLSRNPEGDQADNLAPDRDRVDTFKVNGQTLDLDLERAKLHSGIQVWLFSSDSIQHIPIVAQMTDNSAIERHLPLPLVNWQIIDTPLWSWIGSCAFQSSQILASIEMRRDLAMGLSPELPLVKEIDAKDAVLISRRDHRKPRIDRPFHPD